MKYTVLLSCLAIAFCCVIAAFACRLTVPQTITHSSHTYRDPRSGLRWHFCYDGNRPAIGYHTIQHR